MSKKIFQSNETLEMCDVKVSEDGRIEITTKSYHNGELGRLGTPEKAVRGRMKMVEQNFIFDPYAEASRKPIFEKKIVVSSTTLQCSENKIRVTFHVPRHLRKDLMVMYIQSEIDEVKRRLVTDVYDTLTETPSDSSQARLLGADKSAVVATDAPFTSAPSMGSTQSPLND